jgi:hypothetical protein
MHLSMEVAARAVAAVVDSRARADQTRMLLERSRHRIWSTWRSLLGQRHPLAGGSDLPAGRPELGLRDLVLEGLTDGRLPTIDGHLIARRSASGRACAVCHRRITAPDAEFEPQRRDGELELVAHWSCYAVWLLESVMLRRGGSTTA